MSEKCVNITTCLVCPYFLEDDAGKDCLFNEKHFDDSFDGDIPEWCKLPNPYELPEWLKEAIEKKLSDWRGYYRNQGMHPDYEGDEVKGLKWVLSRRKEDEKP